MKSCCPNCGATADYYFYSTDSNRRITDERFCHYKCPECNLVYISPLPDDLGSYYPDTYHYIPDSTHFLEAASVHERYKIEIVLRFVGAGRLLEIGPSYGCFTYLAKKAGFIVEAIEMSTSCCDFLRDVIGVKAIHSNDPVHALGHAGHYDVIVLWHVIEHIPNAFETLAAIASSLNPGGYLVLAAPNPGAFQFRVMGRYWPHLDSPRHVMLIPVNALVAKMASLGMKSEFVTTRDVGGLGWNIFGWEFFFGNLCSVPYINRALRLVGRFVGGVLGPLERREGIGSAYTAVFRKAG